MTRIVKKPDIRRSELIGAALGLFQTQGYSATTVESVILKTGVAKGTFYHYFKSKEDILEAVVRTVLDNIVTEAGAVSADPALTALEKFRILLGGQRTTNEEARGLTQNLHLPENRELHQKINLETVLRLSPILAEVVEQGIREKVFQVDHVLETIQFLLTGSQFLADLGSTDSPADSASRAAAMAAAIERSLGAAPGSFGFLTDIQPGEGDLN